MASLIDIVTDYSPPNEQSGVPTRSPIEISFDRLVDQRSIKEAFYLEGPDTDDVLGPESNATLWPSSSSFGEPTGQDRDFLHSPGYKGIVQGNFTFTNSGLTTMAFQPLQRLAPTTEYTAYLSDVYGESITSIEANISNVGNGEVFANGPWLDPNNTVTLSFTKSGVAGIAEFIWWKASDPIEVKGPILTARQKEMILTPGLFVNFGDGEFAIDDSFDIELARATLYSGLLSFSFDTGSGAVEVLPVETSSSIISALRQDVSSPLSELMIIKTFPANHSAENLTTLREIIVEFNKDLDPLAVDESFVEIIADAVSRHPILASISRQSLAKRIVVQGRFLKIQL
jgi:hypothetical protein